MAKITTTSYDSNWYIPSAIKARLEAGDEKIVKAEYTRLRDIAQKRLRRLQDKVIKRRKLLVPQ